MVAQSFHSDAEVPAGGTDFDDGTPLDLGLRFTVAVNGTVTHARWRAADHLSGTPRWGLYRQSDQALLGWQDITTYTIGAWNTIPLVTPIPIVNTEAYQVVIWTPNRYVAEGGYLSTSITRGNITAEAQGGRFAVQPNLDYPNNSFNNSCYFVDIVFDDGSGGPTGATPSGQAVPIALGSTATALGLSTAPAGQAVPIALGTPATALNRTAAPSGLALPIALGAPSVAVPSASPAGLAIPVGLGTPAVALGLSANPSGQAVPVALGQTGTGAATAGPTGLVLAIALGQPSVAIGRVASPLGLATPVALGQPSTLAPVATDSPSRPIVATTSGRLIVASTPRRIVASTSGPTVVAE